jgi:glycosyltransferase involved in cell wall biosynthesis
MPARSLVYFSPVRYTSFWQRPHYMAAALLAGPVDRLLWVDPYPTRLPRPSDLRRPSDVPRRPDARIEGVEVISPVALPVEPLGWGRQLNRLLFLGAARTAIEAWIDGEPFAVGVGKPSPLAIDMLRALSDQPNCRGRFYDAMDRFACFYTGLSSKAMQRWENELLPLCDWVQASSTRLRTELQENHAPTVRLCLNGVEPQAVERARQQAERADGRASRRGPVFGYIGTLGPWFDWDWTLELASQLARREPEGRIILVGPLFQRPPQALPLNVELQPPVTHGEALGLAAGFDVGIVPFRDTPLTRCVDPLKYYEYRGLGLPVLATSFGELRFKADPALLLAEPGCDLGEAAGRALALAARAATATPLPEWSWSSRFAPLQAWLSSLGRPVESGIVRGEPACTLS